MEMNGICLLVAGIAAIVLAASVTMFLFGEIALMMDDRADFERVDVPAIVDVAQIACMAIMLVSGMTFIVALIASIPWAGMLA